MNSAEVSTGELISRNDWQTWLFIRHLLPASLIREVLDVIVLEATNQTVRISDLFEEIQNGGALWQESWVVRPRTDCQDYSRGLQSWIRDVIWQSDASGGVGGFKPQPEQKFLNLEFLDAIVRVSTFDLDKLHDASVRVHRVLGNELQCGLSALLATLEEAALSVRNRSASKSWQQRSIDLSELQLPLRALALKHLADLYVDIDDWNNASAGYAYAETLLNSWQCPPERVEVRNAWATIVRQSRDASAVVCGTDDDFVAEFESSVWSTPLTENALLAINGGLDVMVQRDWVDDHAYRDGRVSLIAAPLVHHNQDIGDALKYWMRGKFDDASRKFWSVQRRLIALGSLVDTQVVKGLYGRSILQELEEKPDREGNVRAFELAVSLLLDAGHSATIDRISCSRDIVDRFIVSEELLQRFVARAKSYRSAELQRVQVLIRLFEMWAVALSPGREPLVLHMWTEIARCAELYEGAFNGNVDVARPALKALEELARKKPELRENVEQEVVKAILVNLQRDFFWGQVSAVKTAIAYADGFTAGSLRAVVLAVVDVLESLGPDVSNWPLSVDARRFLVSEAVRNQVQADQDLSKRILGQLLRFGFEDESQPMLLLFHLADFDSQLLESHVDDPRMKDLLATVRQGALRLNASSVTEYIRALLVSPVLSGVAGICDAFTGLRRIAQSAKSSRFSMGIAHLDDPLLLLVEQLGAIRDVVPTDRRWCDLHLEALEGALVEMWGVSVEKPLIFAPFAIPSRAAPSTTVVHNLAFASLRFARAIGSEGGIRSALAAASTNPQLRDAIELAYATHAAGLEHAESNADLPVDESRESFYNALGRRLTQLQRLPSELAPEFCRRLIDGCIRLGPESADAAILLCAANLGLHQHVRAADFKNYTRRVKEDRSNRLLLLPLLNLFRDYSEQE